MPNDIPDLNRITTEGRNPRSANIDTVSTIRMLEIINDEDALIASAIRKVIPQIAEAVDAITARLQHGGRLIYIGAGTSGRLGVLDASECPPTYNTPPELVLGLIAGGDYALRNAVEGIEDSRDEGQAALKEVNLTAKDVVVGIAASGRTPYVLGAIDYARTLGATTVAVCNSEDSALATSVDIPIAVIVGPEVVTGSTRMKAGTAQKMVLNMLSTGAMIRLGKTYGNLMVDVRPANEKLKARAVRIVSEATGLNADAARRALQNADNDVKTAIIMALTGMNQSEARENIVQASGRIRAVIEERQT